MGKAWKNRWDKLKTSKMVDSNPTISIITLNINSLNTTSKRQRLSGYKATTICHPRSTFSINNR